MTLRKLILILSALLVLIPSLMLSVTIYQKVYRLAESNVYRKIDTMTQQIEGHINHQVELLGTRITQFSQHDILNSAITDLHYSRLASTILTEFSEDSTLVESLYLVDNDGLVIESYSGNIPALEESSVVQSFLSKSNKTTETMPTLWIEYFENQALLSTKNEKHGLVLIVPIKRTRIITATKVQGALIAIIPMHKIMEIARQFKTLTSEVSFSLNGRLIAGNEMIVGEQFIHKSDQFNLLWQKDSTPFQLDLNVYEPTEEITNTINQTLSPLLTTIGILLIILLIISMLVANIFANSFNQLNRLIKTFKFSGDILSKSFLISEFNDVSKLLSELNKTINQQVDSLRGKNNELAKVNKQREKYLIAVKKLNSQLEEKVELRTHELKETLDTLEHSHFILEELTHFRRALESSKSNRTIAKIFIESIDKCQQNTSIALYLPDQYQHSSIFIENNMPYITPSSISDIVLTFGKSPTSIHSIMFENHGHHLSTFNVSNNSLGWVILKEISNKKNNDNWIKLFIAELQSYLMMRYLNENLARLASTDSLTGLKNRKSFDQLLTQLETQIEVTCVLYVIDVNGLKSINDEQGHEHGDALIKRMADVLYECTQDITEHVFRVGGDEFAIILYAHENIKQEALTSNLIKQQNTNSGDHNVSFSFGYASSDEYSLTMLYTMADKRMYQDKKDYYRNKRDRRK